MRISAAVVVALTMLVTFGLATAQGFWSIPASGTGAASAEQFPSVSQAGTPTVQAAKRVLTLTWAATTLTDGIPVTGYTVTRYNTSGVAQTVLNGCAGIITTTSCTETGVPDGLYTYTVTPVFQTWTGPQSGLSVQIRSDGTAPTVNAVPNVVSGGAYKFSAYTVYYRGADAGSFTLSMAVVDTGGSGPASATTSALTGATTGWTHTPSSVSTPAGGPYVSNPYSWTAGTTGTATATLTGYDVAGNAGTRGSVTLINDSTPPTGATLIYPDSWDSANGAYSATSLTLGLGTVTDAGSGVTTANKILQQRTAALASDGTCGTFSAWVNVATVSSTSLTRTLAYATCYNYQYVVTDNVGNIVTVASPGIIKNRYTSDSAYATAVTRTSGLVGYYRLGEPSGSTSATDISSSANNGSWSGGPTLGVAGAVKGGTDTAATFDGVDDYATIPRTISTDFSVEFWFKATAGAGSGSNWYDGVGLVDADKGGVQNDFGTSLMLDGRVCAGTGNPDTTICSVSGYNDGSWHHVVFTRASSTGALTLYLDGTARASGTGNTNALTASTVVRVGAAGNINSTRFYSGSMDEVALYNTVLSADTITNHYQTGTG